MPGKPIHVRVLRDRDVDERELLAKVKQLDGVEIVDYTWERHLAQTSHYNGIEITLGIIDFDNPQTLVELTRMFDLFCRLAPTKLLDSKRFLVVKSEKPMADVIKQMTPPPEEEPKKDRYGRKIATALQQNVDPISAELSAIHEWIRSYDFTIIAADTDLADEISKQISQAMPEILEKRRKAEEIAAAIAKATAALSVNAYKKANGGKAVTFAETVDADSDNDADNSSDNDADRNKGGMRKK